MGDYLKAPVVSAINTSKYTGKVNDVIAISADDNHKITAMQVTIVLPNGTALETGAATFLLGDIDWTYKAKSANTTLAGTTIRVFATDRSGNTVTREKVI